GPCEVVAARNYVGISGLFRHRVAGITCNQNNRGEQASEQTSDMHSGSARRLVVAFEAFETSAKQGPPFVGSDERPRIASVSLCVFGVVMYISVAARQRARRREDDVDDEVYSVSGHERRKPLVSVGRGRAHPVRGAARARTVCL